MEEGGRDGGRVREKGRKGDNPRHFCFNLELNGGNLIPSLQVSPRGPKTHTKSWRHDSLGRALKISQSHFRLVRLV